MLSRKNKSPVRFRKNSRTYRVLEEISAGDLFIGFLSSAMSTRLMYRTAQNRAYQRARNKKTIHELEKNGLLRRSVKDGVVSFFVTQEGKQLLHSAYKETAQAVNSPEHWDGKWRVLIYDFPEHERSRRNSLRYILTKSGFLKIQKSVWIFPYDAPLLTALLAKDTVFHSCVIYLKTKDITPESTYKKHFRLK